MTAFSQHPARIRRCITLFAGLIAASALSAGPALPASAASAHLGTASLHWTSCGAGATDGAQCARLTVPLDWSNPTGPTISLALSRVRAADPGKRIGTLLINPGGPGGAGAQLVASNVEVFPQQMRDEFDIVGFDPRGVGGSTPTITCSEPVFDPNVTQFPQTAAQFNQLVAHNHAVGEDCLRHSGPLLAHIDAVSTARDMDAIRIALGQDKLNFLGLSYGSLLGNIYARLYPRHVRAMVLDGPIDHAAGPDAFVADENASTATSLQHFFTWCDQQTSCALHTAGARATFDRLLRLEANGPLPAAGIPGGSPGEVVQQGVYQGLIITSQWPDLAEWIQQAVDGDASALADVADNGPNSPQNPDNVIGSQQYLSIACEDFPPAVTSFTQLRREIHDVQRTEPDVSGHVEAWLVKTGCLGWPVAAADPWRPEPVTGTPPILIVAGKYDPSTPYAFGLGLAAQISGSILLTRSSDGHTGLLNDACAQQRESAYLADPTAPVSPCP